MKRLTIRTNNEIDTYILKKDINDVAYRGEAIIKLGKYEDIDEELGIEYPVLIKALKNKKIYVKVDENIKDLIGASIRNHNNEIIEINDFSARYDYLLVGSPMEAMTNAFGILKYKDYGKTWSLTKKELQNE